MNLACLNAFDTIENEWVPPVDGESRLFLLNGVKYWRNNQNFMWKKPDNYTWGKLTFVGKYDVSTSTIDVDVEEPEKKEPMDRLMSRLHMDIQQISDDATQLEKTVKTTKNKIKVKKMMKELETLRTQEASLKKRLDQLNEMVEKNPQRFREDAYMTHNNGGYPYEVVVCNGNFVQISIDRNGNGYFEHIMTKKYDKLWIGVDPEVDDSKGNTFLIYFANVGEYMYIGNSYIKTFKTTRPIINYYSPVGNNDVPYPYAVDDKNNYYLMAEDAMLSRSPTGVDVYQYYYDTEEEHQKIDMKILYKVL